MTTGAKKAETKGHLAWASNSKFLEDPMYPDREGSQNSGLCPNIQGALFIAFGTLEIQVPLTRVLWPSFRGVVWSLTRQTGVWCRLCGVGG